jgi:hypothetical protein
MGKKLILASSQKDDPTPVLFPREFAVALSLLYAQQMPAPPPESGPQAVRQDGCGAETHQSPR